MTIRKLSIALMIFIFVATSSGCETKAKTALDTHLITMKNLDTYIINVSNIKNTVEYSEISSKYVYVDNINDSFLISDNDNEDSDYDKDDIIFENDDHSLYGYFYEDTWHKYIIDKNYLNIRDFEKEIFRFFTEPAVKIDEEFSKYETYLSIYDLSGKLYNITGEELGSQYKGIDFLVTAYYSETLKRFTHFSFDLSGILERINSDNEITTEDEVSWFIDFSFESFNKDFEVVLDEYVVDDYYDGFNNFMIFTFDERFSYEMVSGSVDYLQDKDVLQIIFKETGLYRLFLSNISELGEIHITILDEHFKVFREEFLCGTHPLTNYFTYKSGTYYVVITANGDDFVETDYRFLFLNN